MGTRSESARESSPSRRKGPRFRKLTVVAAALWASTTTPADGFGLPAAFVGSNSNRNRRYQHGQNTATKTTTSTATATTTTTNRCGRFSEEGNPCLSRRTCLEGPRLLLSRDNSMEGEQRQDDYDSGSDNGSDNIYGFPTDAEPDPVRLAIHQRLQNEDPDWYHEYVSEILGDDYCQTRWPRASSSTVSSSTDLPSIDLQQNIGENDIDNSNNIDENDIDNNNNIDEAELAATATIQSSENSDSDPDPVVVSVSEVDEPEESALPKVEMESESDSETDLSSRKEKPTTLDGLDVTMPTTTIPTATTKTTATAVDPVASANFASASEISGVPETAPTAETMSNETATTSNANTNTTADPRAVLYRNITGNAMTCVPLQDLLDLGYSAPDLERMQSEFLSIVVLDSKTCPSMGVPVQWKVREPSAPPQVTVVDSLEEATAMAASINDQERAEAESKQRRRVRQNDRQKQPEQQSRGRGRGRRTPEDSKPRETDTDRRSSSRRRQPPAQTQTKRRGPPPSEDENEYEYENEDTGANPRSRRKPRPRRSSRRDALDGDGNPKRIYSVPRAVAEQTVMEDPPDIDSPVWVNIDTFRNLLQKESDLRKMFLGEDWDRTIEQENEWRTDLYKKWLWSLHNGVGGSIVPPTRTERARKLRGPPPPQQRPPPRGRRRRERTPEDRPQRTRRSQQKQQQDPQQQRRRRPRGEDPPEPTRRSKRRQSPTGGTAFDNENDTDDDNDGGARPPVSRRRSRLDP